MVEKVEKGYKCQGLKLGEKVMFKGDGKKYEIIGFDLSCNGYFIAIDRLEFDYGIQNTFLGGNVVYYKETSKFTWVRLDNIIKQKEEKTIKQKEEKMKYKKEDFTTRHVVKIRDGRICMISEYCGNNTVLVSKHHITNLRAESGIAHIREYDENLKIKSGNKKYDIVAIKEYPSAVRVIRAIINEEEITDWDWVREEHKEIEDLRKKLKVLEDKLNGHTKGN